MSGCEREILVRAGRVERGWTVPPSESVVGLLLMIDESMINCIVARFGACRRSCTRPPYVAPDNRDRRVDATRRRPPDPRQSEEPRIARMRLSGFGRTGTQYIMVRATVVGDSRQEYPTTWHTVPSSATTTGER